MNFDSTAYRPHGISNSDVTQTMYYDEPIPPNSFVKEENIVPLTFKQESCCLHLSNGLGVPFFHPDVIFTSACIAKDPCFMREDVICISMHGKRSTCFMREDGNCHHLNIAMFMKIVRDPR